MPLRFGSQVQKIQVHRHGVLSQCADVSVCDDKSPCRFSVLVLLVFVPKFPTFAVMEELLFPLGFTPNMGDVPGFVFPVGWIDGPDVTYCI